MSKLILSVPLEKVTELHFINVRKNLSVPFNNLIIFPLYIIAMSLDPAHSCTGASTDKKNEDNAADY